MLRRVGCSTQAFMEWRCCLCGLWSTDALCVAAALRFRPSSTQAVYGVLATPDGAFRPEGELIAVIWLGLGGRGDTADADGDALGSREIVVRMSRSTSHQDVVQPRGAGCAVPPTACSVWHADAHSEKRLEAYVNVVVDRYDVVGIRIPEQRVLYSRAEQANRICLRFANDHCLLEGLRHRRDLVAGLTAYNTDGPAQLIFATGAIVVHFSDSAQPPPPSLPAIGDDWMEYHQRCLGYISALLLCLHSVYNVSRPIADNRVQHGCFPCLTSISP